MNYCTSLNCLVDIRGARRLNHRCFAMWTIDTKNTRYILCNLKNELLYVIKLFSGYQGSERGEWTTGTLQCEPPILKTRDIYFAISKMNYCTSLNCSVDIRGARRGETLKTRDIYFAISKMNYCTSLNCSVDIRGAGRLNHQCEPPILKTRDIYFAISKMNYCTSLNCSVDIRGAGRLNHRYFAMWTTDTKNTRYILCNLKNELLYVIKLFSGYQGGAGRLNHRYFAMWTTDTKNTRYILCNLKNELLYVIKLFSGYQWERAGRLNHRYFAMWTTDTKNTRYILCNLKNELLYVIKLFSGYQGSERGEGTTGTLQCEPPILKTRDIYFAISKMNYCTSLNCSVDIRGARLLNHRCFAMWTTDTKNTRYILCNLKNELLYVIKLFSGYQGSGAIEPPILCNVNHRY